MAVCTADDDTPAWLRAGQTMSALWLGATLAGLGATPASQVVEVDSTRRLLQDEVLGGCCVLRSCCAWAGRPPYPETPPPGTPPGRSLEDVIRP